MKPLYDFKSPEARLKDYRHAVLTGLDGLIFIDKLQKKWGWSRGRRRKWWRSFISSPAVREEEIKKTIKELNNE